MHGDFSRWTFDARRRYRRVLQQQGRVLLDADWNELNALLLDEMQTLARDVIGPHGGPTNNCGFEIVLDHAKFTFDDDRTSGANLPKISEAGFYIGAGHYWADGLLVTLDSPTTFKSQPNWSPPDLGTTGGFVIYLEVRERAYTEWDDPLIREAALLGPDTCFRSGLIWQIKAEAQTWVNLTTPAETKKMDDFVKAWTRAHSSTPSRLSVAPPAAFTTFPSGPAPRLKAGVTAPPDTSDPCILPADAKYRGRENQLYRVEVHQGSVVNTSGTIDNAGVTFKWSRDNGSATFPLERLDGGAATALSLGRDARTMLKEGDIVEVLDDTLILNGVPGPLAQVTAIDTDEFLATLEFVTGTATPRYDKDSTLHPFLRRWDFPGDLKKSGGAISLTDALTKDFPLELGIGIQFDNPALANELANAPLYRTGDYWMIPARTVTGSLEWPMENDGKTPSFVPPAGIVRHYAPIALLQGVNVHDVRIQFP